MKKIYISVIMLIGLFWSDSLFGQQKKVWISGAARGVLYGDDYKNNTEEDTVTARRLQSGHTLVDLGVNIQPSDKILIQSELRVRNDYGGFWGSGVTFDVRQLYIQGIIGEFLKYQIGDINYKLSPYTFRNNVGLVNKYEGVITGVSLEQVQYDLFYYPDNTWRQQGAAVDFSLVFSELVEEMKFDLFTTRIRQTNLDDQDDRLYSGGSVILKQGKYFNLGAQYANLYDFSGTSNNEIFLRNPVYSVTAEAFGKVGSTHLNLAFEGGESMLRWEGDPEAPELDDYFYDIDLKGSWPKIGVDATLGYRDVGPNFRSAGAQTMQIDYTSSSAAYQRYGNDQQLRTLSTFDLYRDASLYNTQLQEGLMAFDPRYDNVTPYGVATPNRRGLSLIANYTDLKNRWGLSVEGDYLTDVVGQGTEELKTYTNATAMVRLGIAEMLELENRDLWISFRQGLQSTDRSGEQSYEEVDLQTQYTMVNFTATLFGDLDFIAEYRKWQTKGNDQLAERDQYSRIIDYNEFDIDYEEDIVGLGLQYNFSPETQLRFWYQIFDWSDKLEVQQNYSINTWSVFFTMNF